MDALWQAGTLTEDTKVAFETTSKFVAMRKVVKLAEEALAKARAEEERLREQERVQREEEERRRREEQERREHEEEERRLNLVNKYGIQNQWGREQPVVVAKVTVVSPTQPQKGRAQNSLKGRAPEKNTGTLNRSLHAADQHGNTYEKKRTEQTTTET